MQIGVFNFEAEQQGKYHSNRAKIIWCLEKRPENVKIWFLWKVFGYIQIIKFSLFFTARLPIAPKG